MVAFSDDGHCIKNSHTARRAFEYAAMLDMVVISHCEDVELAAIVEARKGQEEIAVAIDEL